MSDLSDIGSQATQLQEQQQQTPQLSAEELMQQQLAMQLRDRQSYPSSGAYDDFVDEPADAATSASQYGSGAANDPARRVVHPRYGYAALGGVTPGDEGRAGAAGLPGSMAAVLGGLAGQHPRVHPSKRFLPGQTYEPQVCAQQLGSTALKVCSGSMLSVVGSWSAWGQGGGRGWRQGRRYGAGGHDACAGLTNCNTRLRLPKIACWQTSCAACRT